MEAPDIPCVFIPGALLMATLILAAAGQALGAGAGGLLGLAGAGAVLGRAAGAVAGSVLDQSLFGASRTIETGRLADLSVQTSNEGTSLPAVYGRVRLAGQVIWATRFEEEVNEERQGGKGGGPTATIRSYAYYANFAVALCEGPVARIGRVWADGKPLDITRLTLRLYEGRADQPPDPLIEALQGRTPAYRRTAYVVFERLPLEVFGNRLPQLTFEVIRLADTLEGKVKAVTLIPGAGEFVYQRDAVTVMPRPGVTESVNRHTLIAKSDWVAALDELQAVCPHLESVALVVAWFGDDLRAGQCRIRPKVEESIKATKEAVWHVAGLDRASADLVSRQDGRPAYGGTPSDAGVVGAIKDLKARGLKVMLYPFVLMDIPPGNGLPDPYGAQEQAAYPWRGRIMPTGDPGQDAVSFFGTSSPADFTVSGETVSYSGPPEWRYRRHILHLANLAEAAGGVDEFLIGSELRGMTRMQGAQGDYPFVTALITLASDVRQVLRAQTKISYAADWSEYGAHQVSAGVLRFPLDPLWASADIDFVGIDNYLPLTDMRDTGDPDGNRDIYDEERLRAGIAGGEYYDWYYADAADRYAGTRTPISDTAYGKHWVYRAKDLTGWWQHHHYERTDGTEHAAPTAWIPFSKPIMFTELGIPAIDKGANQPNVFVDPKSAESMEPHFSSGIRDDLIQRRGLEAWLDHFDPSHSAFGEAHNPVSPVTGQRMINVDKIHLWTWDARPFPAFPKYLDVWSDGTNWQVGHWLNGRLGGVSVVGFLRRILADYDIAPEDVSVDGLDGTLDGIAVAGPVSVRQVIEPLLTAFGGTASDLGTRIRLERARRDPDLAVTVADLADLEDGGPLLSRVRSQESELASEVRFAAQDVIADYRTRIAASRRLETGSRQIETVYLKAVASPHVLQGAADRRLARIWSERERVELVLKPGRINVEPGDVMALATIPGRTFDPPLKIRVEAIEDTYVRRIEAVLAGGATAPETAALEPAAEPFRNTVAGTPHAVFLDLPPLVSDDPDQPLRLAAFAKPWPGSLSVMRSPEGAGFEPLMQMDRPATMGRLLAPLMPGPVDVWDRANHLDVELFGGRLETRSEEAVLSGRNALAVRTASGGFEILQFTQAELTGVRQYRLSGLLRAKAGTDPEMAGGSAVGADVVLLGESTVPLVPQSTDATGRAFTYRLVPAELAVDDPAVLALTHTASGRGARPLAPVHLKARRQIGGIRITFIRQTRMGGDGWEQAEVPLAEAREAYEVDILGPGDELFRRLTAQTQSVLYEQADELADFGALQTHLTFAVRQLSAVAGGGFSRKVTRHV